MLQTPLSVTVVCTTQLITSVHSAVAGMDVNLCAEARTQVGALICDDTTWSTAHSPYVLTQSVIIGCGATLTIEPGVVVCIPRSLRGLAVGSGAFGPAMLEARGSADAPIRFTSAEPAPEPGDWVGIHFADSAVDAAFDPSGNYVSGSILEHVIVEYAGAGEPPGAVTVTLSRPFIARNRIRRNAGTGLSVFSGTSIPPIRIRENEITDHSDDGIRIVEGGPHQVRSNLIARNAGRGFTYAGSSASGRLVILEGNTMTENAGGVGIYGSRGSVLRRNRFLNNDAGAEDGGGLELLNCLDLTIAENHFIGNRAHRGGAALLQNVLTSTIRSNVFMANAATGQGGAMAIVDGNDVTITGCTMAGNRSMYFDELDVGCPWGAGGIYVSGTTRVELSAVGQPPNAIFGNGGFALFNDSPFGGGGLNDIDATAVWWGNVMAEEIEADICDAFDDLTRAIVLMAPWQQTGVLDMNGNGIIELGDWVGLASCLSLSGPATPGGVECAAADVDQSGAVDLYDVAVYLATLRTAE